MPDEKHLAEITRLVNDRARWQSRYYEESRTYWDAELPPGGECCAVCYQPVESEPCAEHHPATVAARLVKENERLRARVAELEGAAVCPSVARAYGSRCALPVRHRGDHRNAARDHYWDDTHAEACSQKAGASDGR